MLLLAGCSEAAQRPTTTPPGIPTAPPTPANYDGVPNASTIGPVVRSTPVGSPTAGGAGTPVPTFTPGPSPDDNEDDGGGGPGERLLDGTDPTTLARLYSTPGYLSGGGLLPLTPGLSGNGQPRRPAPTPTLSTNPQAVRIDSLRTTRTSFLTAYKAAATKMLESSRTARLAFASANNLKADRTTWTFLFVAEGPKMWRVIFDSEGNRLDLREVAASPALLDDASRIDPTKVLDSPDLLDKAVQSGLNTGLPVDVVNFQIEGQTKQPGFIFTNVSQGKQVVIQAYTGQLLRNDFG